MHWFWRAANVKLMGRKGEIAFTSVMMGFLLGAAYVIASVTLLALAYIKVSTVLLGTVLPLFACPSVTLYTYVFLSKRYPQDGETRCRKCGYILRGISEPRCPECGERI